MAFPFDFERMHAHSERPWQGDSPERSDGETPSSKDVVTALMVVGYESFYNRRILPSTVLATFESNLQTYVLGRSLKLPDDAIEVFMQDFADRPHVQDFLVQAFDVVERAHARGLATRAIYAQLETQSARMVKLQYAVAAHYPDIGTNEIATRTWQQALIEAQPPDDEPVSE